MECFNVSIIFIPGLAGSKLEYRHKQKSKYNNETNNWEYLWIDPLKIIFKKYQSYLKTYYNPETNTIENHKDIEIRVVKYNETSSIEVLTPPSEYVFGYFSEYFYYIVNQLSKYYCFKRNVDMFAAAYDFRTITLKSKMDEYFKNLTKIVENVYNLKNKKIVFVSHSLGGPLINKFLNKKSKEWKEKYIQGWFSINGVYAPDVVALSALTFGNNFFFKKMSFKNIIKYMAENIVTLYSIFPTLKNSKSDTIFAQINGLNVTVENTINFLEKNNISYANQVYNLAEPIFECYKNDINFMLLYSNGYFTKKILNITMDKNGVMNEYGGFFTDGDGTVTLKSLKGLNKCFENNNKIYDEKLITNADHNSILFDSRTINALVTFLRNQKV